jgi:hypothetical protein
MIYWILAALGLGFAGAASFGLPGLCIYDGWSKVVNGIFQQEVILTTGDINLNILLLWILMSFGIPWGLPLGYALISLLAVSQKLPILLRYRLVWILLFSVLWSFFIVCLGNIELRRNPYYHS